MKKAEIRSQKSEVRNQKSDFSVLYPLSSVKWQIANPLSYGVLTDHAIRSTLCCALMLFLLGLCGCTELTGYSNESLFPQDVASVCLEMFDNQTFRRNVEYELSDALSKRIEADTPYKIISSKDRADTVISGRIVTINEFAISHERETGRVLEKELELRAIVNWKNLKTGELLIDNQSVSASASYSEYQMQDFKYASMLAANKLARNIVELMEQKW